jgi:hypothetical protein
VAQEADGVASVAWARWRPYQHSDSRPMLWHIDQQGVTRCGRRISRYDRVERTVDPPELERCARCVELAARDR